MEKILAIANVVLGIIIFCFYDPDTATVGIGGGIYLMVFGFLLVSSKLKNNVIIIGMGVKASLIGVTLTSIYFRSFYSYQGLLDDCKLITSIIYGLKQCGRIAWDSIMIVLGCLIITVNLLLSAKAFISKNNYANSKAIV